MQAIEAPSQSTRKKLCEMVAGAVVRRVASAVVARLWSEQSELSFTLRVTKVTMIKKLPMIKKVTEKLARDNFCQNRRPMNRTAELSESYYGICT